MAQTLTTRLQDVPASGLGHTPCSRAKSRHMSAPPGMTPDTGERLFVFRGFAPTVLSGEELRASESQPVTGMSALSRPHSLETVPLGLL